jgi:hypothetical protein
LLAQATLTASPDLLGFRSAATARLIRDRLGPNP